MTVFPFSASRFGRRFGAIATAATLCALTIPGIGHAWTENPSTVNLATTGSWGSVVTSDNSGNTYQAVNYNGSITIGSFTVNSDSVSTSAYAFVKYNSEGVAQWVANTGINYQQFDIQAITADNNGNLYVSGSFQNTVTIASITLTSNGSTDGFVAKINNAGSWVWIKQIGGVDADWAPGVDTDSAGNVYVSGGFQSSMTVGSTTLTSAGSYDLFITKLDTSGNFQWAGKLGGIGDDNSGWLSSLAVDASGNSYISGGMNSSFTVNGTTYSSVGARDAFVAKFGPTGTFMWAASAGSTNSDYVYGIALDTSSNVYVSGNISGNATFGSTSLTNNGGTDAYIAKLSSSGVWQWAANIGGSTSEEGYSIAVDSSNSPVMAGTFEGSITIGGTTLTSVGMNDGFIAKWNSTGNFQWAKAVGGSMYDELYGVTVNSNGNIYVSGYVRSATPIFFPNAPSIATTFGGYVNIFGAISPIGGPATTTTSTTPTTSTTSTTSTTLVTTTTTPVTSTTTTLAPSFVTKSTSNKSLPTTGAAQSEMWVITGLGMLLFGIAVVASRRRLVNNDHAVD